jgi:hypothetical protein
VKLGNLLSITEAIEITLSLSYLGPNEQSRQSDRSASRKTQPARLDGALNDEIAISDSEVVPDRFRDNLDLPLSINERFLTCSDGAA